MFPESTHTGGRHTPRWQFAMVGTVAIVLGALFFLLEQDRTRQLMRESVELRQSMQGEIISARIAGPQLTSRMLDFIAQHPHIEYVWLPRTELISGSLSQLADLPRLFHLDLTGAPWVDAEVLADVSRLPELQSLSVEETPVDAGALASLARSSNLRQLSLNDCPEVSDEVIDMIIGLPALQGVDLERTGITLDGFSRLRNARRDLRIACVPRQFVPGVTSGPPALQTAASLDELTTLFDLPHDWETGHWRDPHTVFDLHSLTVSGPAAVESVAYLSPQLSHVDSVDMPIEALAEIDSSLLSGIRQATVRDVGLSASLSLLTAMTSLQFLHLEVTAPPPSGLHRELMSLEGLATFWVGGPGVTDDLRSSLRNLPTRASFRPVPAIMTE